MFGVGMPELLVILAVALMVLGPERLPKLAYGLGRLIGRFRAAAAQVRREVDAGMSAPGSPPPPPNGPTPHAGGTAEPLPPSAPSATPPAPPSSPSGNPNP